MSLDKETNEKLKVSIACIFGGLLGTIISYKIFEETSFIKYFWWVGTLLGGGLSYFIYVADTLPSACKKAWNEIIEWKIDWKRQKTCIYHTLLFSTAASSLFGWGILFIFIFGDFMSGNQDLLNLTFDGKMNFLRFYGYLSLTFYIIFLFPGYDFAASKNDKELNRAIKECESLVEIFNPFFPLILVGLFVYGLFYAIKNFFKWMFPLCSGIKFVFIQTIKFIIRVFVLIHTDMALLCLVSGTTGALIGFYYGGNEMIGGLCGLAIGNFSREIIAKRVLKVVPLRVNGS